MKHFLLSFCSLLLITAATAQHEPPKTFRNFPLVVSLQFHSLSFPFKHLRENFKNVGIGIGSEIALGSGPHWAQEFNLVCYRNRAAGNGLGIYTQSAWRPGIAGNFYGAIKLGVGCLYSFRPVQSYQLKEGKWIPAGHRGKWLPVIPVAIGAGLQPYSANTYAAPFINYQLLLLAKYNNVIPVLPNTLIQVGSAIHFKH